MPKPKPPLLPLHQIGAGQLADCFAILSDKTLTTTRDGKTFVNCKFKDRQRTVNVAVWSDSVLFDEAKDWPVGQFFKLRGTFSEHERYGPKFDLANVRPATDDDRNDGFRESDLIPFSQFDPEAMFANLGTTVERAIQNEPLKQLVLGLLNDNAPSLKSLPASARHYYPFPGGWLEHTTSVLHTALLLSDWYTVRFPTLTPPLNRDLVAAGAVLHDLGRLHEFAPALPGVDPVQTIPGSLLGHQILARDLVREKARTIEGLDPELLLLLEHILLSHLTKPEWGSVRLPAIPEVLILHNADDLDAKFEMYARCLANDLSPGPFTERDPILNKPLLKRRSV